MIVTNIAKNLFKGVGEGPHYDSDSDYLYIVDIPDLSQPNDHGKLFRRKMGDVTAAFEEYNMGANYTSFAIPTVAGKTLVGSGHKIVEVDWPAGETGAEKTLHTVEDGLPTRFNDGKCDPRGRLLAGTMSLQSSSWVPEAPEACSLFGMDLDRSLKVIDDKHSLSNGLAWTSDEQTLFFIDSTFQKCFLFDYDIENFAATNRRVFYDFSQTIENGFPDGCTTDVNNRLWIAFWNGNRVMCFDTTTGQKVEEIHIPAKNVTSCCFAGPSLNELIVTTSFSGAPSNDSEAGSLFRVTNMNTKGHPMAKFAG